MLFPDQDRQIEILADESDLYDTKKIPLHGRMRDTSELETDAWISTVVCLEQSCTRHAAHDSIALHRLVQVEVGKLARRALGSCNLAVIEDDPPPVLLDVADVVPSLRRASHVADKRLEAVSCTRGRCSVGVAASCSCCMYQTHVRFRAV